MQIIRTSRYISQLQNIMEFIAEDSITRALAFQENLDMKIESLTYMSYKFRKSLYFDDENIRDFIFKGYVIPYAIDIENDTLTIIGIKKYQQNF